MGECILVVAAHPDDEVLGCGGTMAKHADAGDDVHVLLIADGVTARAGSAPEGALKARNESAYAACELLGARPPKCLAMPDNALDTVPLLDIVKAIETMVSEVEPSIVYTHCPADLNIDHQRVHQAVMTAARPLPGSAIRGIYAFEVLSSTGWGAADIDFRPNRFVDIELQLDRKQAALQCYSEEMREFPHARSDRAVEALARYRGASVGFPAAEAFVVLRELA